MKEDIYIGNVQELVDIIQQVGEEHPASIFPRETDRPFIFRGMADRSYDLLPAVYRLYTNDLADVPQVDYRYGGSDIDILKDFIQEARAFEKNIPEDDLYQWLITAQHYGAPTRLLDWTSNPLVALYFACCKNDDKDGVIWILHRHRYKELMSQMEGDRAKLTPKEILSRLLNEDPKDGVTQYPTIFKPYYLDRRMSAQSSWFMAWGAGTEKLDSILSDQLMTISNDGASYFIKGDFRCLLPVYIDKIKKYAILEQLDMLGINEKMVFPGMDGIGRSVNRKYDSLRKYNRDKQLTEQNDGEKGLKKR